MKRCGGGGLIVKIVVTHEVDEEEFAEAVEMVESVGRQLTLVIQPATTEGTSINIDPVLLLKLQALASGLIKDVRVIPQRHPLLGLK